MRVLDVRKALIILSHAFIGWALCGAAMGIGLAVADVDTALIVHAAAAPVIFFGVALNYFKRFAYTTPLQTAFIFVGFVILTDFFVVALLINRSLEMFTSPLGTWIPFALLSASTYLMGLMTTNRADTQSVVLQ